MTPLYYSFQVKLHRHSTTNMLIYFLLKIVYNWKYVRWDRSCGLLHLLLVNLLLLNVLG